MKIVLLVIIFILTSCSSIWEPLGLGRHKKSPKERYHEQFGTVKDYPNVREVSKDEIGNQCKKLGDYKYESSWKYEEMKLVFYKYVQDNKGDTFYRIESNEKAGLMSELNRHKIRYFRCIN